MPTLALNGILKSHLEISSNLFVLDSELTNGLINFYFFFFLRFFLMWPIPKVFIEFVTYCPCSVFRLFGHEAYEIPAPQPRIEPAHSLIGRQIPNHWKSLGW